MKAYLNTTNCEVIYPPFDKALERLDVISGTPLNDQLYFLYQEEDAIVYAPYDHFAARVSMEEYEYLRCHNLMTSDVPEGLMQARFYQAHKKPLKTKRAIFSPSEVSCFLGDTCNLNCVYCNAVSYRRINAFDSEKMIDAFKVFIKNMPDIGSVSFFGNGEPLLYFDTVKALVEVAKRNGIESFYMTSNGVLGRRTEEIVDFLVGNGFETAISLDGYETIQNLQRPTAGGQGSFADVMRTIQAFAKYGDLNQNCFCRFTLTKYASMKLSEIVLFFHHLGFSKIRYAELIPEGNALSSLGDLNAPPTALDIVQPMVQAILLAESLGVDFTGDYDPRQPTNTGIHGCAYMAGTACAINTNMELLACMEDRPEWTIGKIEPESNRIQIDAKRLRRIQGRNMAAFNECRTCPVKCGGGCTHYSFVMSGDLSSAGDYPEKCQSLQAILAQYLSAKLAAQE